MTKVDYQNVEIHLKNQNILKIKVYQWLKTDDGTIFVTVNGCRVLLKNESYDMLIFSEVIKQKRITRKTSQAIADNLKYLEQVRSWRQKKDLTSY